MFIAQIKLWVLEELCEKESSGYELLKKIGSISGKKPSPGYIYPLLNDLESKGFVSVREDGRSKIYTITPPGNKLLNELKKTREEMIKTLSLSFEQISDKKDVEVLEKIRNAYAKNKDLAIMDKALIGEFHKTLFEIQQSGYEKKKEEVRDILKNTINQLKELQKK